MIAGAGFSLPHLAYAGPQTSYSLAMQGQLWGNSISSSFQFDDEFNVSSMNMNLYGPLLRADAGDISANWDQLSLAGRSFQGLTTGFTAGKVDVSLLGGNVVIQPDLLNTPDDPDFRKPAKPITSKVYGARASLPLGRSLNVGVAQLFTPDAPQSQGGTISTLALDYQPTLRRRLGLELARSENGTAWQLSASREGKRLMVRGSYRQAENGFSSAGNPMLRTRRNGGFVAMRYRLAQPLTLAASAQRYDDGFGGHSISQSVTLRFARRNKPSVSLFWRESDLLRLGPASQDRSTVSQNRGVRLSHRLGANRLSLQYEQVQSHYLNNDQIDRNFNRISLGWTRPLGRQTEFSLLQMLNLGEETRSDKGVKRNAAERSSYTAVDVRHRVGDSGLRLDLGLQLENRRSTSDGGQALSLRAGLNYRLSSGSSIDLQLGKTLRHSGSVYSSDRFHMGYTHRFGSNRPMSRILTSQERRELGTITGRVFEDQNSNGRWDAGEPGVANVSIGSPSSLQAQTDRNGLFSLANFRPGNHSLHLVTKTLPIEYSVLSLPDAPVTVVAGKSATLDIPVVRTGQVSGVVFLDSNRNRLRDEGETGVGNVMVRAEGSEVISFTDAKGNFTLHGLAPIAWKVSVESSFLGEEYQPTSATPVEVRVIPNGVANGVALGIAPQQREVVTSFIKGE